MHCSCRLAGNSWCDRQKRRAADGAEVWLPPADMVAAVGPAIGSCCYPTGGDVAEKLSKTISSAEGMFVERDGNVCPDLKAINALQLLESGVGEVDVTELCTACNPQTFYSHRQSGGKTGRQGAIASII